MAKREDPKERIPRERDERKQAALAAERRKRLRGYAIAAVLGVATVIAVVVAVSGGGDDGSGLGQTFESTGGGHVHGLGVNPADGAVFVASHNGLFRAARGEARARPVGTAGKDVMGFSIVGPNRFLGSGHPGDSENLPSSLGLIASSDAGRSFQPVSLLGEVDFHILRGAGTRVYGSDSSSGRFLVSRDAGRSWSEQRPPAALIDLAVDPRNPDSVIASTDEGLFASGDGGRAWRALGKQIALIAWAAPERLYMLDQEGRVAMSSDGGRNFRPAGRVPGEPVSLMAAENELYVALADNRVMRSADGGATWSLRTQV
jgi:photosystem II stability/assembly factor-like uncharacterized protein